MRAFHAAGLGGAGTNAPPLPRFPTTLKWSPAVPAVLKVGLRRVTFSIVGNHLGSHRKELQAILLQNSLAGWFKGIQATKQGKAARRAALTRPKLKSHTAPSICVAEGAARVHERRRGRAARLGSGGGGAGRTAAARSAAEARGGVAAAAGGDGGGRAASGDRHARGVRRRRTGRFLSAEYTLKSEQADLLHLYTGCAGYLHRNTR